MNAVGMGGRVKGQLWAEVLVVEGVRGLGMKAHEKHMKSEVMST